MSETDQKPPKFNLRWNKGGDSYRLGDQYKIFQPFRPDWNEIDNNDKKDLRVFFKKKKKKIPARDWRSYKSNFQLKKI